MDYAQDILSYIKDKFGIRELSEDDFLFTSDIIDSFAIVELVSDLEQRYGVQFGEKDLTKDSLKNIRSIAGLIEKKKNG